MEGVTDLGVSIYTSEGCNYKRRGWTPPHRNYFTPGVIQNNSFETKRMNVRLYFRDRTNKVG